MHRLEQYKIIPFLLLAIFVLLLPTGPVMAQDAESDMFSGEYGTGGIPEEGEDIEVVEEIEDTTPIGIVDEIFIEGNLVTSRWAVLRQMTFEVGDEITAGDISFCEGRLRGLNGIYWTAEITWDPAILENHITITVTLGSRRTWFAYPSISSESVFGTTINGGVIGDRNFLGSADMVSLSFFPATDDYYYAIGWRDPQFNGGHQSFAVDAWTLDTFNTIKTDTLFSAGESYHIDRNGIRLNYRTSFRNSYGVGAGYRFENIDTAKRNDRFSDYGDDNTFFFTGSDITPGNVGALTFDIGQYRLNSRFWPTEGYYWSSYNEIAAPFTLSDFTFTRHTVYGAAFWDIYRERNVLGARILYSAMTGDPPNYEMNEFSYHVRGYTSGIHRGKSLLAMNFEYRFIAEPEVFQGVLFADFGRAWDDVELNFDDLHFGYGAGIRIYTAHLIPYNLLIRLDYGITEYGSEMTLGFNHFF